MTEAEQFYQALVAAAPGRVRVEQELLWRALRAVHPEIAATTAARAKLRDLIDQLVLDGQCERANEFGRFACRLRFALQAIGQRAALDQFEREERLAFVLADLEDLNDIRMLKLGGGGGLGSKSRE